MHPRRLRQELEQADRLAAKRRTSGDDQVTVVPFEYQATKIRTGDEEPLIQPSDFAWDNQVTVVPEDYDPKKLIKQLSQQQRGAAGPRGPLPVSVSGSIPLRTTDIELVDAPPTAQGKALAPSAARHGFDSEQTRIDPASDPDLVVVESKQQVMPAKKARGDWEERTREKTVIRRLVESVVAVLPKSIQNALRSRPHQVTPEPTDELGDKRPAGVDARAWREIRTAPIFDGLPNEAMRDALLAGDARVLRLERDSLLPLDGATGLIRGGQVAIAVFSAEVLASERKIAAARAGLKLDKKEKKRRAQLGPLIGVAEKNLATFEEGDVVETAVGAESHPTLACYAVTPVSVIIIARSRVELWKRIYPFMADRFRRAAATARAKLDATDGAKAIVADFFIRHGLSVSMTLRVRKLDACIECGACEKACEDRYGVKRLSLNGRILGGLDFVDACHTCTDQRCIDPCNFDAISYDAERKEVLINEANCTGCTLCAAACPYDAIEMHDLDEAPLLKLRLQKQGSLAHGEGTPRKAKLRRMASKCDHCAFYEDQACISACPTGALLELLPSDVFSQLPSQVRTVAKNGFDKTTTINIGELNTTSAFHKALPLPELGRGRAARTRIQIPIWWTVGLTSFALALLEITLRLLLPQFSLAFLYQTMLDNVPPDIALGRIDYRPGCELAVNLGYVGTGIMITGMAYVPRRRLSMLRRVGSLRAWFDWHVMSGVVGPLFILLHTAAKLDNWISIAFWSMIGTVLSGVLGRYLTTQLPERASKAAGETLEVDRRLMDLRKEKPGVRAVDGWFEIYRQRIARLEQELGGKGRAPTFFGAVRTFFWVLSDDLGRPGRRRELYRALKKAVTGHKARHLRREAIRCAERLALLERRRVLLPRLEPLFKRWKAVHVPMAIALTVIAAIHIALALRAG